MPISADKREEITAMSAEVQEKYIQKRTEKLLQVRERSCNELVDRLSYLGFADTVIEHEIERVKRAGLVDDERFARLFIDGKKRSLWGRRRIESELGVLGVSVKDFSGYPQEFFEDDDEIDRAKVCLSKFKPKAKNQYQARYMRLVSKGFTPDIIRQAISSYETEVLAVDQAGA